MHIPRFLARSTGLLAAAAAALALAAVPASAATSPDYTEASYLQRTLGLPAGDANPVIEPVTFDRFQWLLQQPGDLALLIGDPATDATFASRAQDVEAAAKAAGAKVVYWFNPNLSGSVKVGGVAEPALDIRDPGAITTLPQASRDKYGSAWLGLVGSYLGDGITATWHEPLSEEGTIEVATGTATVNDKGRTAGQSTKVGDPDGGALYDYTSGTPATAKHSFFLIYNKADATGKVVSWTDLTTQPGSAQAKADVTTAIGKAGAAGVTEISEFAWWKDEVNARQQDQAPNPAQGVDTPVLGDADGADWRIHQITYPELVDLLEHNDDNNAVILFGGTWCPNTRPVLPSVNKDAKENDVQVYNFDTVLDGGFAGGATTSSSNPLQIRNTQHWAVDKTTTIQKSNPSFLYGDLVDHYLTNIKTQYDYTKGGSSVTYYSRGDYGSALTTTRKLQVPFLIGYRGAKDAAANGGVSRQWIIKKDDGSYTEYMSQWWYTNPKANQLGITTIPLTAPIWATINAQLAGFTWQTDPKPLYPNTAIETDDADYLVADDKATVKVNPATSSAPASVSVTSGGATVISPAALSAALAALGASAPANLPAARTALIAQQQAGSVDPSLTTVVGAWGVAQLRKTKVLNVWGNANTPGSVAGGLAAVHALEVFFSGLPRGVASRRTITADGVVAGTAPRITVKIANDYGRVPAGDLSLVVKQGDATVATASAPVAQDQASFTLPALPAGTYDYTLSYGDDAQLLAFTDTGSLTVSPAPGVNPPAPPVTTTFAPAPISKPVAPAGTTTRVKVGKVKGIVAKAPTSRKTGKYTITVATPKGGKAATGKITIKLKKGKATKTLTGTLKAGTATVTLPKLARGTWKVTLTFPGDTRYLKTSVSGASIKVIK